MSALAIKGPSPTSVRQSESVDPDLERLRTILLGKDYKDLLALKQQLDSPQQHSEKIAAVVSEALAIRTAQDNSLSEVLSPTIENALTDSIERDPQRLANALYPVMGPAIRKSINEVLTHTFDTFNQLLEQSLSPKSLQWRFDAWRSGRNYAEVVLLNTLEYQVEQVFLIHAETGLLLRHAVSAQAISKDPDMVSGMLTAIQDFVADSFDVGSSETLKNMRLGALNVVLEQGPYTVIAAVVRGNVPAKLPGLLHEVQEDIHRQMHNTLRAYNGDSAPFVRVQPLLEKCLLTRRQDDSSVKQARQTKPSQFKRWLLCAMLVLGASWFAYQYHQSQQHALALQQAAKAEQLKEREWQRLLTVLNNEPGIVVLQVQRTDSKRLIRGLRDPAARRPQALLDSFASSHAAQRNVETVLDFKPYLSGDPALY